MKKGCVIQMQEQKIIESQFAHNKGWKALFLVLGILFLIAGVAFFVIDGISYGWDAAFGDVNTYLIFAAGIVMFIVRALIARFSPVDKVIVTDKRVIGEIYYGRSFHKRVDLPMDSISAVAIKYQMGLTVCTSGGKISFLIEDRDNVYNTIINLLIQRNT